jgi:hypothetical protein
MFFPTWIKNMKQYMLMEAMLPRCSAEHRELSTIRPNLIRTQSNRPELSLSIQQLYLQWSPSLRPERYGFATTQPYAKPIITLQMLNYSLNKSLAIRLLYREALSATCYLLLAICYYNRSEAKLPVNLKF